MTNVVGASEWTSPHNTPTGVTTTEWLGFVGALHATPSATMLLISSKITVSALKGLWVLCSRVLTFSFGWRRTFSDHYS